MDLLGDDSDNDLKFTINENYAKRYDKWRQGEELQKLKDRYGDEVSEESSTSEDEDEDAKELTEDIERDFFKTLSCLKEKNPKIYDKNVRFFKSEPVQVEKEKGKKKKAEQSMSLGEYQRKVLLEKQGQFSDDEDNEKPWQEMTNVEQEKALKESFKDVLNDSDSENEKEGWGSLFKKRVKTQEELKTEEDDYRRWLAGEKKKLKNSEEEKELKGLHDYWSDPKLDEGERFLRDYILNKRFLEKEDKDKIPDYDEIVQSSGSDDDDETTLEQQEEFERKYNFRFEEPDQEFIKRYPRTLEQSMRKKDDRRKRHREEVKARKEKEKAKKVEELKRLKALKRKEIMDKIKKLQQITGNENMEFQKNDLEEDFDPEEHDRRMSELFNEEYYGTCEDEEKPENPELDKELEIENWDNWGGDGNEGEEEEELHCEDPGFNMDCDYDPSKDKKLQNELIESTKKRKKRRKSKFSAAVAREKPVFDPKDKTFESYIDEYYALDYEDLIGDLPCRFKYRKVVPNDFGLSVEEILAAPDKELNRWVSVKKIMQRRPEHVELYDVKAYKKKARDFNKKKQCLPSLYDPECANEESVTPEASSKGKKLKNKSKEKVADQIARSDDSADKKPKKRKFSGSEPAQNGVEEKKKKKFLSSEPAQNGVEQKKKKKFSSSEPAQNGVEQKKKKKFSSTEPAQNGVKQKKKKFKSNDKFNDKSKNSQDSVYGISDSRLKAYGINPKKLRNKLKYGKKNQ